MDVGGAGAFRSLLGEWARTQSQQELEQGHHRKK